jgi:hypothetical protein
MISFISDWSETPRPEEGIDQSAEVRDLAKRARRLADHLTAADRGRLLCYAEELETQAADLERRASGGPE